jgi:hypothetical protein
LGKSDKAGEKECLIGRVVVGKGNPIEGSGTSQKQPTN